MKKRLHKSLLILPLFSLLLFCGLCRGQTMTGIEQKASPLLAYHAAVTPVRSYRPSPGEEISNRFDANVLEYINEMRQDPPGFYTKYLVSYIRQKKSRFTAKYTRSLQKTMMSSAPLPLFETNAALQKAATRQLDYLAGFGGHQLTHEQGNISFAQRMKMAGLHCLAENLYAADDPLALDVVLDLLIDQNIPSYGHRLNLMNPAYTHISVVSKTPQGGRTLVVMDFGCKINP